MKLDNDQLVEIIFNLRREVAEATQIIEDMCFQFALRDEKDNNLPTILYTMGMSDLEMAFAFLGWDDPHIIKEIKDEQL